MATSLRALAAAADAAIRPGIAVCLSGGGFRATLYHLGALRRLNASGLLARVDTLSSVSGGSYLNAVLAARWHELDAGADADGVFLGFDELVTRPTVRLCGGNFRGDGLWRDLLDPRDNFTEDLADLLDARLLGGRRLGALPDHPRFVFNATCYSTAKAFTFAREHRCHPQRCEGVWMGDYRIGYARADEVRLAVACVASSAHPVFPPLRLRGYRAELVPPTDPLIRAREGVDEVPEAGGESWRWEEGIALGDGGIHDNLGLEAVYRPEPDHLHYRPAVVLVSDGNGVPVLSEGDAINPVERLFFSVTGLMESAMGYRLRTLLQESARRTAATSRVRARVWRLASRIEGGPAAALAYQGEDALALARLRTDLDAFTAVEAQAVQRQGWLAADAQLHGGFRERHLPPPGDLDWIPNLAATIREGACNRLFGNG